MEKKTFTVDEIIEGFCTACNANQNHLVGAVDESGQISKLACQICGAISTFKGGVKKTAVKKISKKAAEINNLPAAPYDRNHRYDKGQAILHPVFGRGEIKAVVDPQKMDVMFGKTLRRLLHNQS